MGKAKKIICITLCLFVLASVIAYALLPAVIPLIIFTAEAYTIISISVTTSSTITDVIAQRMWHEDVENVFNDQIEKIDSILEERQNLLKDNPDLYYEKGYDKQEAKLIEEKMQLQNMLYYSKEGNIIDMRARATQGSIDMLAGAMKGIVVTQVPAVVLQEMGYVGIEGAKIIEALLSHATSLPQDISGAIAGLKEMPDIIAEFTGTPRTPAECEQKYNALIQKTGQEYELKIGEISASMNRFAEEEMMACLPGPGMEGERDVENDPACRDILQKRKDIEFLKKEKSDKRNALMKQREDCKMALANTQISSCRAQCEKEIGDLKKNCEAILKKDMGYLVCTSCIDFKKKGIALPSGVSAEACSGMYAKPDKQACEDIFGMTACLQGEQDKVDNCVAMCNR